MSSYIFLLVIIHYYYFVLLFRYYYVVLVAAHIVTYMVERCLHYLRHPTKALISAFENQLLH